MANASDNFEDGFILRTVPFGSVVYPLVFVLFWILFKLKLFLQRKINIAKLNKLGKWNCKRLSWVAFTKVVKLFHDLKQFLFNLFVLDLSLASCFELCQSRILAKMFTEDITTDAIFSMLLSAFNLILIIFEFYYTLTVNLGVKMTQEAKDYTFLKSKIILIEKLTKRLRDKNKRYRAVDETSQNNKLEEVLGIKSIAQKEKEKALKTAQNTPMAGNIIKPNESQGILMSEIKIEGHQEEE
jgi:hypothetical protein